MPDTDGLSWAAITTFIFGVVLLYRSIGLLPALLLCGARILIPFVYFSSYFDWTWHGGDDLRYEEVGQLLRSRGFDPLSLLFDSYERQAFVNAVGSGHFLYYWWNDLSYRLLGDHYFSPIFFNVACSFVCALLLARLMALSGMEHRFTKGLTCFFLIHPEVTAWSSFVNLKDTLVLTLTVALLLLIILAIQRRSMVALGGAICVSILFSWLRFYVPFFALTAIALLALTYQRSRYRYLMLAAALGALGYLNSTITVDSEYLEQANTFGLVRFLLTPQPWSLQPEYSFLLVSATFHWVMLVPSLIIIPRVWNRSMGSRLVLLYFFTVIAVYTCVAELQGPRHRYQIAFIFAWLQFEAICHLFKLRSTQPSGIANTKEQTNRLYSGTQA